MAVGVHAEYRSPFVSELELVKLPEDITLAGFTPLMLNPQDPSYVEKTEDMVSAQLQSYITGSVDTLYVLLKAEFKKKKEFCG